jgi:GTP-binding protein HflX
VDDEPEIELHLLPQDGEAMAWLYQNGRIIRRDDAEDGSTRLAVRLNEAALGRFERQFPGAGA